MSGPPPYDGLEAESASFPSSLESLGSVLAWFQRFNRRPVPADLWIQAETGLVEAYTNAVRHAHGSLGAPSPITVRVEVSAAFFALQILDRGGPYDLEAALALHEAELARADHDPLDRDAHWGQFLLLGLRRSYGWELGYQRLPDGSNVLSLRHALPAGEGEPLANP